MLRVYLKGTPVRACLAQEAMEEQLGITPGRYTRHKSGTIDITMRDGNNGKKTIHGWIKIEGRTYRIGPTFPRKQRVVAVILRGVFEDTAEEAVETFVAALGKGAVYLAAEPDHDEDGAQTCAERVYLSVDPEVRMRDVVPRMIKVDGEPVYIDWYHAGPFCRHCGKTDHTKETCGRAPQRPRKSGPIAARKEREDQAPPAAPPTPTETIIPEETPSTQATTDMEVDTAIDMATNPAGEELAETAHPAPTERESEGHAPANAGEAQATLTVELSGTEIPGTEYAEAEPTAEDATAPQEGAEEPACDEDAPTERPDTQSRQEEGTQNESEPAPREQAGEEPPQNRRQPP
jgi:hypothetical protein